MSDTPAAPPLLPHIPAGIPHHAEQPPLFIQSTSSFPTLQPLHSLLAANVCQQLSKKCQKRWLECNLQ